VKLHFIGICGTGMGAVAGLCKAAGHEVRGSDAAAYPPMSDQLRALGVTLYEGFRAENLDWQPDRVVVGNVNSKDHVEVAAAEARKIALTSFPAVLEDLFLGEKTPVVVTGTHGKTTTTSLLAFALADAGRDPSFLVGGVPQNFSGGYRLGAGPHFVLEGDEYDTAFFDKGSKFLHYKPRTAILTSIELDHVDIFADFEAVKAAFRKFVALLPADGHLIVAASSPIALEIAREAKSRVESYGVGKRGEGLWHAEIVDSVNNRTTFDVRRAGEPFGRFEVGLVGEYNVENALAAIAAGAALGLSIPDLQRALRRFRGVKRRQEVRGVAAGVTVVDDYGHHPTAIRETLAALRKRSNHGKLLAIYEPRSATSRRKVFQTELADAFGAADEVVIARLFAPEKIPEADRFDPERLANDLRSRGTAARLIPDVEHIVEHVVERVQPGDWVVVFSSGGFDGIHEKLLYRLGDPILPAKSEDMRRVREMLDKTGQRAKDATDERAVDTLIVADEEGIVGCVMLELYDDAAVLRSLAVIAERRGRGLGWMLADRAVGRAREAGARRLYLLTESASDFFAEKFGFRSVDRSTLDPAVANSPTFREARSGVAMRLDL
jgi:UDP-N-acetylmuramate: L-alanyl-gamma-D-glutamyl-meso-diaminopimelate ligase